MKTCMTVADVRAALRNLPADMLVVVKDAQGEWLDVRTSFVSKDKGQTEQDVFLLIPDHAA